MKILIIRFSALGDVILTTGVIRYIRKCIPELTIDVMTYSHYADVFKGNPDINNVLAVDKQWGLKKKFFFMAKVLKNYDHIFDLHAKFSGIVIQALSLLPFNLKVRFHRYKKDSLKRRLYVKYRLFKKELQTHVTTKYFEPFREVFSLKKPEVEDLRPIIYVETSSSKYKDCIVVHPFASKKTKEWPYTKELVDKLTETGKNVCIIGNKPYNYTHERVTDLGGQTGIADMFKILSNSKCLITTDSGPMHAAIALNIPVVAIFGPTTREFGFFPVFSNSSVVQVEDLKCRPCHVHGSDFCRERHFRCMKDIHVCHVMKKIQEIRALNN